MELSTIQATVIVSGVITALGSYFGKKMLEALERIPNKEWFTKVDQMMDEVLVMKRDLAGHTQSLHEGSGKFREHSDAIRTLELANARRRQ